MKALTDRNTTFTVFYHKKNVQIALRNVVRSFLFCTKEKTALRHLFREIFGKNQSVAAKVDF